MSGASILRELKQYESPNTFNPYSDKCEEYDRSVAPAIRRRNLKAVVERCLDTGVDSIWLGRDLGYKGGRRTGLALTDEVHLHKASDTWKVELHQATKGEALSERTAYNIWRHLDQTDKRVFLWNIFPFHPHQPGDPLSNRAHTAVERDYGLGILELIVSLMQPAEIVAIGNDADICSRRVFPSRRIHKVRHPSYGGERKFSQQLIALNRMS